jgi:hypothetical protein
MLLALLCALVAVAMMAAVLSTRFNDGFVGKLGFIVGGLGWGAMGLQLLQHDAATASAALMAGLGSALALAAPDLRRHLSASGGHGGGEGHP